MTDDAQAKPSFDRTEVLRALQSAATRGLTQTRNAESDLFKFDYDLLGVEELIGACTDSELTDHEVSHHYPEFNDYIAELKIDLVGERTPFYAKVALRMRNND